MLVQFPALRLLYIPLVTATAIFIGSGIGASEVAAGEKKLSVSAYYYPWYDGDGRHWDLGYPARGGTGAPALGEYSSRNAETVRQHLAWSKQFGIDNWICSWWGPESWEDLTLRQQVLPELEKDAEGLTFCLLYESEGLLGLDAQEGIVFDAEKTESFVQHFRFLLDHYLDYPSYQRIDGKPVVYLYLSRTFSVGWERALLRARAEAAARDIVLYLVGDEVYWGAPDAQRIQYFDAITAYNMHGPRRYSVLEDWSRFIADCGGQYQKYKSTAESEGVVFIPNVMPGFDTAGRHYTIPRSIHPGASEDSFLAAMLKMARPYLDSDHPRLDITSFNEWHEGTQLEPSAQGDSGANGGAALRDWKTE